MTTRSRASWASCLLLGCLFCCCAVRDSRAHPSPGRGGILAWAHCPRCALEVGLGTTYFPPHWTDGVATPIFLEIDRSRWEIGGYRFLTNQFLKEPDFPPSTISARPFCGFTAMHRWLILHRARWRLYLGFGAAYQTPADLLDATQWNFAYLLALRYSLDKHLFFEFSARHWSNAWIKLPNRGQDLLLMSIGFH